MIYNKIIIGVDGSEHSYKALLKARDLQKLKKSEVIVFYSIEHYADLADGTYLAPPYGNLQGNSVLNSEIERIKEAYEKTAQLIMDKAREIFLEVGIEIETRIVYKYDPVSYIKERVNKEHVDLVIIGSKGTHSLLSGILLGSVAEKVLRHVPCDILIIR